MELIGEFPFGVKEKRIGGMEALRNAISRYRS